jgi:hypothetical protein
MLVVLLIIGIMGTVAATLFDSSDDDARLITQEVMETVKKAILGSHDGPLFIGHAVSGYVQDMGNLPPLNENGQPDTLWLQGQLPSGYYNEKKRIWAGWNGPYLDPPESGYLTDGWGNGLLFEKRGKDMIITSSGADRKLGGTGSGEDLVMKIRESDYMAPIGGRFSPLGSNATLNYPERGVLLSMALSPSGNKQFMSRSLEVPIGLRSISMTVDGQERCVVFMVHPTMNWLGKLQ